MKAIKQNRILIIIGILALFSSCSPEYVPNMVNSPMFTNAGEFQATIATGTSNFDAHTAAAITDHIGIMINGSYGNETNDTTDNFHKHSFIEGGVGYYDKFGTHGRYEIFGGYGFGKVEGYFENIGFDEEITDARYNRFFIQPGIGVATGIYDGSFSPRISLVQMDPKGANFPDTQYDIFFEPVITSKVGFKYLKFIIQFGVSIPVGDQAPTYDHERFIMNFGLNFNFGRKYFDL